MTTDLQQVIVDFQTGTYDVIRQADGDWLLGRWVAGSETTIPAVGMSIQPATGDDMEDLPEGVSVNDVRSVWTSTELRAAKRDPASAATEPGAGADRVIVEGYTFVVMKVSYFGILSGHYRATIVKKEIV